MSYILEVTCIELYPCYIGCGPYVDELISCMLSLKFDGVTLQPLLVLNDSSVFQIIYLVVLVQYL